MIGMAELRGKHASDSKIGVRLVEDFWLEIVWLQVTVTMSGTANIT